jgi:serralysin
MKNKDLHPDAFNFATTLPDFPEQNLVYDLAVTTIVETTAAAAAAAAGTVTVPATGNPDIDGVLSGVAWDSAVVTYSFPDSPSDYPPAPFYRDPTVPGFTELTPNQQHIVDTTMAMIESYTNLDIVFVGNDDADVMLAQSRVANPTSYAYYPSDSSRGGDVWFGTRYDYAAATLGEYTYATVIHEIGHAFGLKHSHEDGGPADTPVPVEHDALEYSIMSYRSYEEGSTSQGYTNEDFGFPQTFMIDDIAALQTMYGANYNTHSGNTVYSWSPTTGEMFIDGVGQGQPGGGTGGASANRVFLSIWDGGGNDTYDMSNYDADVTIDLNPGSYSITAPEQRAYMGDGQYAHGNIYNAYLFEGDPRSYIENGFGGSGNDTLLGNPIGNDLEGGLGDDIIRGMGGNDGLDGGRDNDVAFGGAGRDVIYGGQGNDILAGGLARDTFKFEAAFGTDKLVGFEPGRDTIDLSALGLTFGDLTMFHLDNNTVVATPEGTLLVAHVATLHFSDFVF